MATKTGIDLRKVSPDLQKAGVPQSQIKSITAALEQQSRLRELQQERKQLASELSRLDARIAQLSAAAGRHGVATATGRRGRPRLRPEAVPTSDVYAFLKAHAGTAYRREELAEAMKVESGRLREPLNELVAQKKVKRAGQRRGTSYKA